jgi:competence protein ComFC
MSWLDLIFPKYCVSCKKIGSYLCQTCQSKIEYLEIQFCSYCYRSAISGKTHANCRKRNGLDGVISLANYKDPVKALVKSLKYRLTTDLLSEFAQKFQFLPLDDFFQKFQLLPLPLHLIFEPDLLKREKATTSQVGLKQKERSKNISGAFTLNKKLEADRYLVFDDVWTSGASLKEAAKVLKKAGAEEVWGLTLAHPR